jgi:hypothetical protein
MLEVLIEGRSKVTGQAMHRMKMVRRLQQRCLQEETDVAGEGAQLPRPCGRSCASCPVVHHAEEMAASAGRVVGRALSTEEVYQLCAALAGPLLQGHYAAEGDVQGESA